MASASKASPVVQRVQANAPTLRRVQQQQQQSPQSASPSSSRKRKKIVRLTLGSPFQHSQQSLPVAESLRVLDMIRAELSPFHASITVQQRDNSKKRRRAARASKHRAAKQAEQQQPAAGPAVIQEEEKRGQTAAADVSTGGFGTQEGRLPGLVLGFNSTTRALETALSASSSQAAPAAAPFVLLVLASCFPPSLTAHYATFSHCLRLPLLTLHPSVTSRQFAAAVSPALSSLLALGLLPSAPSSLLAALTPLGRVEHVDWLDGLAVWKGVHVERVERRPEREIREERKRRQQEAKERKERPLSPKSQAAAIFRQRQKEKEDKERAAREAAPAPAAPNAETTEQNSQEPQIAAASAETARQP